MRVFTHPYDGYRLVFPAHWHLRAEGRPMETVTLTNYFPYPARPPSQDDLAVNIGLTRKPAGRTLEEFLGTQPDRPGGSPGPDVLPFLLGRLSGFQQRFTQISPDGNPSSYLVVWLERSPEWAVRVALGNPESAEADDFWNVLQTLEWSGELIPALPTSTPRPGTPTPTWTPTVTPTATQVPEPVVYLALRPVTQDQRRPVPLRVGQVLEVEVRVDFLKPASLDGVQADILFDPRYLEVTDAKGQPAAAAASGEILGLSLLNEVDGDTGRIRLAFGRNFFGAPVGDAFTLARFYLKPRAPIDSIDVWFATGQPDPDGRVRDARPKAAGLGGSIPTASENLPLTIGP